MENDCRNLESDKLAEIIRLLHHFFSRQRLLVKLLAYFCADFFHTQCAVVLMFLFKYSSMFNLYLWFKNLAVAGEIGGFISL